MRTWSRSCCRSSSHSISVLGATCSAASTPFFIRLWMILRVFRFGSCYIGLFVIIFRSDLLAPCSTFWSRATPEKLNEQHLPMGGWKTGYCSYCGFLTNFTAVTSKNTVKPLVQYGMLKMPIEHEVFFVFSSYGLFYEQSVNNTGNMTQFVPFSAPKIQFSLVFLTIFIKFSLTSKCDFY